MVGSDTYGDGWNGGSLKVVATSGKVYFGPWSGPTNSDGKAEVTTSFDGPCSAGTYEYNNRCINCPIGRYGIRIGQNNIDASCAYKNSTCPPGYFCSDEGGTAATPCPSGKYGNRTGQTAQAEACPYACPPGAYGLPGKTDISSACVACPAGAYCNGNGTFILCPLEDMEEQISQNKQTCLLRVHTFVRQESLGFSRDKYRLTMYMY